LGLIEPIKDFVSVDLAATGWRLDEVVILELGVESVARLNID
jgi:hypothetical protein